MLDIKFIRANLDLVKINTKNRQVAVNFDELLTLDEKRRDRLQRIEKLRAERKKTSRSRPSLAEMKRVKKLGETVKKLETELKKIEGQRTALLYAIPNLTHPQAPIGNEDAYTILDERGGKLKFKFTPQGHEMLLTKLGLIDFARGAKVTGSKFYFYKNDLVRLNQALIQYGLELVAKHGYTLMETPDLAKSEILDGSGFNPRGQASQIYKLEDSDLHLIGTAEITLLGYHANEILNLSKGPIKYAGLSHCYRTEAGAYGKASQGLYRVHQFTKLEMFIFCQPEDSERLHQELLDIEKEICDGLGLAYRVIDTPSGDLGGPAYRKFDLEAALVMSEYGEITSASNCTDYQARRLNITYRKADGGTALVHTLNGTAIALSRFPLAIVEQCQQSDGSILVPKVLRPSLGKQVIA